MKNPPAFLCIASFFKGNEFLRGLKASGCTVYLVTSKNLEDKEWAWDAVDDVFYVPQDAEGDWHMPDVIEGMAWVMRNKHIDRIAALDDFDVEKAAELREHFRIPGMGQTTFRHFRDKLAMRIEARDAGIRVPGFSPLFSDEAIRRFAESNPGPWIIKPRWQAASTGMKKVHSTEALWAHLDQLGARRHQFLVEQFKPGVVYHVDSLSADRKVVFARTSRYLETPFEVTHEGGIFRSVTEPFGSKVDKALLKLNAAVKKAFGYVHGASHCEFIQCHEDGAFYFLETSARVGGANIAEMVEASSGINLWYEWARLEAAVAQSLPYQLPALRNDYAGILISLTRQEWPDTAVFNAPEIVWRMSGKPHHLGLIVRSPDHRRVLEVVDDLSRKVMDDFNASAPAPDKPTA
jgi:hypothetical protein